MENTTNNEVITKETEATSSEATSGTFPWKDDDVRVMTAGETAIGVGIIGGLSVLAWEAAIKPLGKKVLAAGKAALQKAKRPVNSRRKPKNLKISLRLTRIKLDQ